VKWLVLAGIPAMQIAFFRYAVSFGLSLGNGLRQGQLFSGLDRRDVVLVSLRGSLLVLATVFNFIALNYLPLSVTSTIMNASPILVTILAIPLLGERVGPWRWAAVILGFIGVLIVIRPFGQSFHWATLLILANATGLALFSILTRQMAGRVTPQAMQIYMGALGTFVLLPFVIWFWTLPQDVPQWIALLSVGLLAWAGHEKFSRAHLHAEAGVLSPFGYVFILYMTLGGYLVFNSIPDAPTLVGAAIIVASGLLIWWREGKRRPHDAA
jgi:drug/metabolite transporter (DMT)-like permease